MKIKIETERIYCVTEVAIICGVSEATVRSWIKKGELSIGHSVSNQGYVVKGWILRAFLRDNSRYDFKYDTIDIPDDRKREYLLAAKTKCVREISAANVSLRREMNQLDEILKELFEEES